METVTIPQVRKSGGLIGAELSGLDLTREYPGETYQAILRAWVGAGWHTGRPGTSRSTTTKGSVA